MYKICMKVLLALSLTFAIAAKSHAVFIGFTPAVQPGATGDFVSMDLIVSGLGAGAPPSVSTFDVDIGYDMAAVAIDGWTFSTELGDIGAGEAIDFSLGDLGGTLALSVVSFLLPFELDAIQGSTVTLATITFEVLALGPGEFTDVTLDTIYALGDGIGDPLDITREGFGRITNGQIPEPGSVALLLLGLAGLSRLRRS